MTPEFVNMMSSSSFFEVVVFLLSSLATVPSFMSISWLAVEFWQFLFLFLFIEVRKLEIPLPCPIFGDWEKLAIPNLARMSLIKCYWLLQNVRIIAFTVSELWRETNRGRGGECKIISLPTDPPGFGLKHSIKVTIKFKCGLNFFSRSCNYLHEI